MESTVKLAASTSPAASFVTVIGMDVIGSPAKIGKGTEVPTTAGPPVVVAGRIVVESLALTDDLSAAQQVVTTFIWGEVAIVATFTVTVIDG